MAQGNYDHPSYIVRQQIVLPTTTAGANGTSAIIGFPASDMKLRKVGVCVKTAGTSTSTLTVLVGTASVGSIVCGTGGAGTLYGSGDCNVKVPYGTQLGIKNGSDATIVVNPVAEMHIDASSTWT